MVEIAEAAILGVDGVRDIADLKARWQGHQLHVSVSISIDPGLTVTAGHNTAHKVEHELHHAFKFPVVAVIHMNPFGETDAHQTTSHHQH